MAIIVWVILVAGTLLGLSKAKSLIAAFIKLTKPLLFLLTTVSQTDLEVST
ncbi:MAG: hypothetical protein Q7T96_16855 [Methylobacter sp.]|nr:hypothetical protein [Methylobacter sp.]